jgi:hypothetical protein
VLDGGVAEVNSMVETSEVELVVEVVVEVVDWLVMTYVVDPCTVDGHSYVYEHPGQSWMLNSRPAAERSNAGNDSAVSRQVPGTFPTSSWEFETVIVAVDPWTLPVIDCCPL